MSAVKLIGTIARQVTCGGAIWLGLAASAWADTTSVEYIHTDALGSPVAVTNASGAVIPANKFACDHIAPSDRKNFECSVCGK